MERSLGWTLAWSSSWPWEMLVSVALGRTGVGDTQHVCRRPILQIRSVARRAGHLGHPENQSQGPPVGVLLLTVGVKNRGWGALGGVWVTVPCASCLLSSCKGAGRCGPLHPRLLLPLRNSQRSDARGAVLSASISRSVGDYQHRRTLAGFFCDALRGCCFLRCVILIHAGGGRVLAHTASAPDSVDGWGGTLHAWHVAWVTTYRV